MTLFSHRLTESPPILLSILPAKAKQLIVGGQLPTLAPVNFFLKTNETCHYADRAIYEKRIETKRRLRKGAGYSTKGLWGGGRIHFGHGITDYTTDISYKQIQGILYITNQRIAFVGEGEGFSHALSSLVGLTPYSNCVELQLSKENLRLFVPDGNIVNRVLHYVIK